MKIDIPSILVHLRAEHVDAQQQARRIPSPEAISMAAAAWTMADADRWSRAQSASRAGRLLGRRRDKDAGRIRSLPGPRTGARDAPRPPTETFRRWWERQRGGRS